MSQDPKNPFASPTTPIYAQGGKTADGNLATLGERFLGGLIDGLIMLPIAFAVGFVMSMALVVVGFNPGGFVARIFGALLGIAIFLGINGYFLAKSGQTIGKIAMGTRIVSDDGNLVPFAPLILKRYLPLWLVSIVPWISLVIFLINALLIFRENRKCGHDEIAGTKVIKIAK